MLLAQRPLRVRTGPNGQLLGHQPATGSTRPEPDLEASPQVSEERSVAQADRPQEPSARVIVTTICGLEQYVQRSGHTQASALKGTLLLRNAAN